MTSRSYTTTGGLVFFTASLSLLLHTDVSSAWSVPRNLARRINVEPTPTLFHRCPSIIQSNNNIFPTKSYPRRSSTSLSSMPQPLATEGDWAAYVDEQYDRIYYFNHVTGESVWSKPTETFPDVAVNPDDMGASFIDETNPDFLPDGPSGFSNGPSMNNDRSPPGGKPTLYQILNVPFDATRSQIKASYLELAKRFHPDAVSKRGGDPKEGQRVFNDISRAWMVLSDDGLRRGYDESLNEEWGGNETVANDNAEMETSPSMTEEEETAVDQNGIRDATILMENKFAKDPVYKKKMDMSDGRANKFARGGGGPSRPPPPMENRRRNNEPLPRNVITTAPPLEIDYEAEAAAALTASQATLLAQNAWADAISAEKASLQRDAISATEELQAAQYQAQRWNQELENERREQQMAMRQRQEERRRNAERGVVDGRGNAGGRSMEERLRMRKMQRAGTEAERVGRELTKLGGLGAGLGNVGGGSSGIVGGPSEMPDAFFGGSMPRSTAKTSANIREEQRLNSLLKKGGAAGQGQPQRSGPMVAERPAASQTASGKVQTRNVDKEMNDLKIKYEAEIDRLKTEMMQIADKSQSNQLKELVSNHKKELERVKQEMEIASDERLENELSMLEEKHASEMQMMEQQLQAGGGVVMGQTGVTSEDQRVQEMENVINKLKEEHSAEVASLKDQLAQRANSDQSEKLQQLEESHKREIDEVKLEMEAAAAKELKSKLQEMESAHQWQLQSLQSGHQAEMSKSQKAAADKLSWEVERSISTLKRDHEREIQKLKSEVVMNVSESDAIETMRLNHAAEMELLRAELFGEAAKDLEDAIASLTSEHRAEIEKVRADAEKQAEEQVQKMQEETQAAMAVDLQAKASQVENEQQKDMEQIKAQILANANLTESEQIKKLEATHRQEVEDLKKAADARLEEEILKIAQIHAAEITKLRDDLEASAANTIRDIQTESARQRQMEVERAVSQLQMQQDQERERIRQELMREIEQDVGTKVFSQKADMERLKSDLDLQSKQVMAAEIRKLKQAHIGEMEKLKRDVEKFYNDKMEQTKKDMIQQKRSEIDSLTTDLKKRHAMELERAREGSPRSSDAQRELNRVAEEHQRAIDKLRQDLSAQAEVSLQQKIDELNRAHQNEIEEIRRSMKAAAVADTLQFQTQANVQRTAEVDKATQALKEQHQKELELLRRSMMVNANSSEKERMEILEASHREEIERTKAQMEASFAKRLENELQLLEQSHRKRLNEIENEMENKTREFAKKEAMMQTNQSKQVQKVQAEMQAMKEAHAEEMMSLKSNLLKNSDGLYKKQIDDLTASFNAELERVKAAAVSGKPQLSELGSTPPQNIEDVLNNLQTIYPPETIKKLREELRTKNADLSRLDRDIINNTQQMNALQTKLNASEQSQQTLSRTIQSLETWKQKAETDIKTKASQLQAATAEVDRLKREGGMRSQSTDTVATLQKEMRTKTNEVANLNAKIQTLTKESADLKSRLEAINKEKAAMTTEINQLKEWKQKAEANQKKERDELESQISRLKQELAGTKEVHKKKLDEMDSKLQAEAKDKRSVIEKFTRDLAGRDDKIKKLESSISDKNDEISTLKHGLRERNEDVNTLVPEVARLQTLNAEMKSINDARLKEFSTLKAEAARLKQEFEKGNSENLATVQKLTAKLENEQAKHKEFIKKLEETAKIKADEIISLQSNLSDKTKKISDLEQRLGSMTKMSTDLARLEEYRATTDKSIAESKRTIQALQNDLEKGKVEGAKKAARIKELERLQESMFGKDGEIQRLKKDLTASGEEITRLKAELSVSQATNNKMAQDISEFKSVRYSSEASLKKSNDELAIAQRDVARLKREIENLKQSDSTKTQSLRDIERKLREKESELKSALASKESEVLRLSSSASSFASERDRLLAEVEKLSTWKINAEETIASQCKKIDVINSQLQRLERELEADPSSEYETLLKERASLIQQLARVKNEFVQKSDRIKTTKIQTENLLRRNLTYSSSIPSGATVRTVKTPILSNNVVIGEFTNRRKNIATTPHDQPFGTQAKSEASSTQQTYATISSVPQSSTQLDKAVVSPPKAPTLTEISSNVATELTKEKPAASKTMSAYDLALAKAQQAADAKNDVDQQLKAEVDVNLTAPDSEQPTPPMSGWAGYKHSQWGGYLDNLDNLSSDKSAKQSSSMVEQKDYQYKDNSKRGFGYLENLSAKESSDQKSPDRKEEYLAAEKTYLVEAKNLALEAAKSFQEVQSKPNDKDALENANAKKRKVDELLAKAREMRAKAEEITN